MNQPPRYPSLWNLAANPVFRRHTAARLRLKSLCVWVFVSQVIACFLWLFGVLVYMQVSNSDYSALDHASSEYQRQFAEFRGNAFMIGWLCVLVFQGCLVILKGTFSVATGVAREDHEGMMDAMLLTPLPTGHKVVGQLLGLPVLENVVALLLVPWALLSALLGGFPPVMVAKVYLLFATAALLHHAIGLVAGTIIHQKILAGTISQLSVILLHFVLPAIGGFGIGMISHFGVESAILRVITAEMPVIVGSKGFLNAGLVSTSVKCFAWEFERPGYHWIITVSGLIALLTVLVRRWNNRDSQLLGKVGTALLACWVLVLTCGELLPTFADGGMPSQGMMEWATNLPSGDGAVSTIAPKLILWSTTFGVALCALNLLFASMLVPSPRTRLGAARQSWWGDDRNALPWVAGISLMVATAWGIVIHAIIQGAENPRMIMPDAADFFWLCASIFVPAATWYALILWRGWKPALFVGFIIGVLPLMVAIIGLLFGASFDSGLKWLAGASGLVLPAFAASHRIWESSEVPCGGVFITSLTLHAVAAVLMFLAYRRSHPPSPRHD